MTLAEGDIKVIREGETHLIAVCISGFVTSVVCFCALYTANKYRLYKGPHWLKLKTHPITSQNFVEFQFSSVCRSPTVKLCCFMQHILEETETYVYTWVYPSSCHVWSLAVEGGGSSVTHSPGFHQHTGLRRESCSSIWLSFSPDQQWLTWPNPNEFP